MRQSQLFGKTIKEAPKDAVAVNHQYLARADFIEQTISGVYRFLPLGFLVLKKIENIIREEMLEIGAQEVFLPTLQDKRLWLESNRWQKIDPPLFILEDRHKKETALGPTHEEEMTDVVRKRVSSYQDLPFALFQIQNKFRNEMRATSGLLRTREFLMKDLYSFDLTQEDLNLFYQKTKKAYFNIFERCGLKTICVAASSGTIGGKFSEEFMALSETGEDRVLLCEKCGFGANVEKVGEAKICPECQGNLQGQRAIEVGHIFQLGTKYSESMKANFRDHDGSLKPVWMGCYGIGLGRLMATIVEASHDEKGIVWPKNVAPFAVHLLQLGVDEKVKTAAEEAYSRLEKQGIGVLFDDRQDKTPGEKFADADLIGIPLRLVVSEKTLKENSIEVKKRGENEAELVKTEEIIKWLCSKI